VVKKALILWMGLLNLFVVAQRSDSLYLRSKVLSLVNSDSIVINKNLVSSLAAFEERDSREVPGSLIIITEEEIAAMNAKDLMDVLLMTSSIALGRDVEDGIGIALRGNWAQEGKVLVMINGVPVNDLDYGTYNLGGRVSLNMVSRVEITMGPGSVKYGGTAALGVINVVLKTNSEFVGSMLEGDLNYSRGINTRKSFSYSGNYSIANKYKLSVGFNTTKSLRSTVYQILPEGDTLSWADSSQEIGRASCRERV
jgi:outer membrane receptor protein involved in Fe transport